MMIVWEPRIASGREYRDEKAPGSCSNLSIRKNADDSFAAILYAEEEKLRNRDSQDLE